MLLYLRMAHDARQGAGRLETDFDLDDTIMEGAAKRIRAVEAAHAACGWQAAFPVGRSS
jgi:hypothetical protein